MNGSKGLDLTVGQMLTMVETSKRDCTFVRTRLTKKTVIRMTPDEYKEQMYDHRFVLLAAGDFPGDDSVKRTRQLDCMIHSILGSRDGASRLKFFTRLKKDKKAHRKKKECTRRLFLFWPMLPIWPSHVKMVP